jgi:hypothetical protein
MKVKVIATFLTKVKEISEKVLTARVKVAILVVVKDA